MARDKAVTGDGKGSKPQTTSESVPAPAKKGANSKVKENGGEKKTGKSQAPLINGSASDAVPTSKEASPVPVPEVTANGHDADPVVGDMVDEQNANVVEIVQDIGFNVEILSPGPSEPLAVQVSSMELVQEIHQLLMDREDKCHRTCFSLQLDGVTLDKFAELKNINGLQEMSVLQVVEEPYTMREARIHVRHIRDLLKSTDPADAYNGQDCSSLTFLSNITQGDLADKKKARPESVDCTPPEFIMPGAKDRPILPLYPVSKNGKGKPMQAVKILTTSAWNPPPGPRKLHGDLMYLYVVTMEDKRYHISACPRGFYVNQSTDEVFNPKPDTPSHLSHSLVDLLSILSPTFKRVFPLLQKKRTEKHPFERIETPYQVYTWCAPQLDHSLDAIRAEDTFSAKLGYEEHIPWQSRDWNEEIQSTREFPRKNLAERLFRERAIFKVHSGFVTAATRGAMAVIDGNVMAINPGEETKNQMFIWNNIFFSLGFDIRDHYKELGGDAAAFVAPRNDLHGVRVYSAVDVEGLYILGTVVIDYRGYRVTAQSIIPGILEKEQEQSVVYGSIDFGKTVLTHPKYLELLNKASSHLRIQPHSILSDNNEEVELCSSVECKGIIGNDGRHYILDLLKTFPPDVNFLRLDDEDAELSDELKAMNFPIKHKHKLSCLRQELLDAFYDDRYVMFIKNAALGLQQMNATKLKAAAKATKEDGGAEEKEKAAGKLDQLMAAGGEASKIIGKLEGGDATAPEKREGSVEKKTDAGEDDVQDESGDSNNNNGAASTKESIINVSMDILSNVCAKVGSLKATEFDIRFNPDVFSAGIKHVDNPNAPNSLKRQKQLIKDAAEFLVLKQIPAFVNDFSDHTSAPIDGVTLTEALHARGINVRYLGKVAQLLAQHDRLEYLHTIAVMELILRATKHIFTTYIQNCEMMSMAAAISHFLNCFLTSAQLANPLLAMDELQNLTQKRRNKKNKKEAAQQQATAPSTAEVKQNEWAQLTQRSLWLQIKRELKQYWDWDLGCDNVETVCEKFRIQKISLLRGLCIKVGLQIALREYSLEGRSNKVAFYEEDIVNVFPVVKHINPRATDAYNFFTSGQQKIQQGLLKEGYDLISESLNLLNNVYGALHPECVQCLRMLARLSYIMGDAQEAMNVQQRAVLMSERVHGVDHQCTISEYAHLALYCFANSQISTALKLLYRARYLTLVVFGENHPEMALLDSNISLILHAVGEYELSLRFLEHALALNIKYYGDKSPKVAVSYHLVARTQSCMGDFRSALNNEKEAYAIYKEQLGFHHEKTKDSLECLRHLTQQAVVLQKKMNDIYSNGKAVGSLPPIHIQPPSMGSVLEMLNVINGILFVQISPKDIANLKNEIEKRQKEEGDEAGSSTTTEAIENGATTEAQVVPSAASVEVQS